jgi:Beta protein
MHYTALLMTLCLNDLRAVGALQAAIWRSTKPLVEAMPLDPKKSTVDEHVAKFCGYVRKHAPLGDLYVDFFGLDPDAKTSDGCNAIVRGYQLLKAFGRPVTPVYGLERNDAIWGEIGRIADGFASGFAFRLGREDLADYLFDETWGQITERSAEMKLREQDVDIVLDFGSLSSDELADVAETVVSFLFHNPRVRRYRNVIVAGSSALKTVADVPKDGKLEVVRSELHLWSTLWRDMPDDVKPVFGDYGVIHPKFSDLGANQNMNAKVRYTVGDRIIYYRGHGLLRPVKDFQQYHGLARRVRADTRYRGREFSFGDAYLDDCAQELISHGAPATWVKADMNHHITYACRQTQRLLSELATETVPDLNAVVEVV